ncbi:hypothetical protein B0H11DRAFT_1985302 [Mycena galericulata]|nr:hypothetical protein B0H11DRAFT_1985302 [Mycena galericulata]
MSHELNWAIKSITLKFDCKRLAPYRWHASKREKSARRDTSSGVSYQDHYAFGGADCYGASKWDLDVFGRLELLVGLYLAIVLVPILNSSAADQAFTSFIASSPSRNHEEATHRWAMRVVESVVRVLVRAPSDTHQEIRLSTATLQVSSLAVAWSGASAPVSRSPPRSSAAGGPSKSTARTLTPPRRS